MDFDTYQELAMRTAGKHPNLEPRLAVGGLGIAGEAGEVADYLKKVLFHGHDLDKPKLIKELGDVLWYAALLSDAIDVPMSVVAETNIEKLKKRYPNGFSVEDSIHRKD